MYGLLSLLGIVFVVLWIITPFMVFNLSSRVRRLERLVQTRTGTEPAVLHEHHVLKDHENKTQVIRKETSFNDDVSQKIFAWVKEDWLLKMGGLLLLIGFGWLTTYAFMNNWIGPMGRIGLGIIAGTLLLLLGTWRMKTEIHQGGVFLVVGSTTILLTVFAARQFYGYFTPTTALGIMFLSCAYVALVSVKFNNRALSLASVILAGIAPLLTNSPTADFTALFAYLLIVVLGTVWIVAVTQQREITAAALILVTVYSIPHLLNPGSANTLLFFAYAFAAIFFVTNITGIIRPKDKSIVPDTITAAGNGLFLLAWIMTNAPEEWRSLIIAGWMLAFIIGAFMVFRMTNKREPFYVYAGVGIAMLAAATTAELSGAALTIAFTVEVAMISVIAYTLTADRKIGERLCILFFGSGALSLSSIDSSAWFRGVLHQDFFVLLVLGAALMALGLFYISSTDQDHPRTTPATSALVVVGSVYLYALLWLSLHALLVSDDIAVMISLLIYTVIGLITYFFGRVHGMRLLGIYGGILLGLVIARLLLVDIWNMSIASRFVTFFVVGILLMSTAFFGRDPSLASPKK